MLKKPLILMIISIMLFLSGCSSLDKSNGTIESDKKDIDTGRKIIDYYPFLGNTILDYEGSGIEFAEQTTFFEFIEGERAQLKVKNPGTNIAKVVEYKNGELIEILSEGEFYHIENLLNISPSQRNVLLKEPIEVGNSWPVEGGYTRRITGINVEIETPYKVFKALEVTTDKDKGKEIAYYVKGTGLVANIYKEEDHMIASLLKDISYDSIRLAIEKYYPLDIDSNIVYVKGEINFNTNAKIEEILEDIMKNPPSEKLIPLISSGTRINSISLNRNDWIVRADFSQELVTDMNYGTTMETKVLESIVNTLGRFYDVDKVSITVDGKAYESGHYYFKEDDEIKVNVNNLKEFKL